VKKKQHDMMNDWIPHQKQFLFELLNMEAPHLDMTCTSCLVRESQICCLDCLGSPTLCHGCGVKNHCSEPFNKIEAWNGWCFVPSDLNDIGLLIHLGHGVDRCPKSPGDQPCPQEEALNNIDFRYPGTDDEAAWNDEQLEEDFITVVHTTGVYKRCVHWCQCDEAAPHHIQLLRMKLYPASVKMPQTAFTFSVLDHFYIDAMECKTSANNFFSKLKRLTSNAFPHTVPVSPLKNWNYWSFSHLTGCQDRYRELLRVSHQWRVLLSKKRFGFGHDRDKTPGPGDLALFCPACPQAGVNLTDGWERDPDQ
jgi:hypothetical protein